MTQRMGYKAIVEKIIYDGKHGPYAVARAEKIGTVTFSLDRNVWFEKDFPEPGTYVFLAELRKKRAGWRAYYGRFIEPSDEE
jgi:hypothetical protein